MASGFHPAIAITGGGTGALDKIDGADLSDKDGAFVILQDGGIYIYALDADSALSEDSPRVVSPDANAGDKRWILQHFIGRPRTYSLGGNTTFAYGDGDVFFVDPNGANRNFNPTGTFPTGFKCWVVNTADAAEVVTFDSTGLVADILVGQTGIFTYNGSNWY